MAVKRLEEHLPAQMQDGKTRGGLSLEINKYEESKETLILHSRWLRRIFGAYNFQRILYSTLIGEQVVVRGPKNIVENIIKLLQFFVPARKVRSQEFGYTYKPPDVCNFLGLDMCAAVPMSTDKIIRLDIVPFQELENTTKWDAEYSFYNFIVKNERKLPEKLPSLLIKIDKALADESLSNKVVWLRIKCLMEEWFHMTEVIREVKKRHNDFHTMMRLMQSLGVQEQDDRLIEFWTS